MIITSRKILLNILLGALILNASGTYAQNLKIRDANLNPISITTQDESNITQVKKKEFKKITNKTKKIYIVVGKTTLIRFNENVKRISMTSPQVADIIELPDSPKELLISGKQPGATSFIVWGEEKDPKFFDLIVKNNADGFLDAVNAIGAEDLDFNFTDTNVILSGYISSSIKKTKISELAKAYGLELIDISECPTPQVLLKVKVAEASRAYTKNLASRWSQGAGFNTYSADPDRTAPNADFTHSSSTNSALFDGTIQGLSYFITNFEDQLGWWFTAGEQKGKIKLLAEPKLVTTNGEEASFNAGQEVPFPAEIGQNGQVSYDFKSVGVNLKFTPTIMEDSNKISLKLSPEVSEIDSTTTIQQDDGSTVFGFKTRKVDTTVELKDGETLVIAGLLKHTDNTTKTQIPVLGDIPYLGRLFQNRNKIKDETELVIFVTPTIVDTQQAADRI